VQIPVPQPISKISRRFVCGGQLATMSPIRRVGAHHPQEIIFARNRAGKSVFSQICGHTTAPCAKGVVLQLCVIRPDRRTFSEEGVDPFRRVGEQEILHHHGACVVIGLGKRHVDLPIEGVLADDQRMS
jgi:hypothetical protein